MPGGLYPQGMLQDAAPSSALQVPTRMVALGMSLWHPVLASRVASSPLGMGCPMGMGLLPSGRRDIMLPGDCVPLLYPDRALQPSQCVCAPHQGDSSPGSWGCAVLLGAQLLC